MNANMHALIIGRTRSGKSKLLQSIFTQTLLQQGTCAILEPHFEFSMDSLKDMIAAKMFKSQEAFYRLIYMDFNNGYYWPLNILAGDERKIRAYDEEEIETVVETALDIMTRIWPELNEAPQFTEFFTALWSTSCRLLPCTD